MQQRVAIARALAYQPRILLMDEPFASVDAQTRADLEDLVLEVRDRYDVTILFVTHDIDESVYLSDRIVVLTPSPTEVQRGARRGAARARATRWRRRSCRSSPACARTSSGRSSAARRVRRSPCRPRDGGAARAGAGAAATASRTSPGRGWCATCRSIPS